MDALVTETLSFARIISSVTTENSRGETRWDSWKRVMTQSRVPLGCFIKRGEVFPDHTE